VISGKNHTSPQFCCEYAKHYVALLLRYGCVIQRLSDWTRLQCALRS